MKIAYYSNVFFTDCDFPLVKEFQKQGNEILYFVNVYQNRLSGGLFSSISYKNLGISSARDISEFRKYDRYLDLDKVYVVVRSAHWYNPINIWITIKLFLFLLKRKIQILHFTYELGISELFLYFYPQQKVLTIHDPFSHSGEGSKYGEIKRRFSFNIVNKLVLLNQNQKNAFIDHYGLHNKKILINSLGRYDCLNYVLSLKNVPSQYNVPYVLFFGHFSPYKGIDVLCEAMKRVHDSCSNLKCVIAGKGNLNFDVAPYVKSGYVEIVNRFIDLDELVGLISNCLFVVCPYKDATQSGVISSSFALDKPVLATNVGGLSETVIDEYTGKLVSPNSPEELANAILYMVNKPDRVVTFSKNIEEKYSQYPSSWTKIADDYIKFYKESGIR